MKMKLMRVTFSLQMGFVAAAILLRLNATSIEVDLGTANNFAVLAGSTVTSTGPTVINGGNVGVSAGSAITGFPPGTVDVPYTIHAADAVAAQAQTDLTTAYNQAAGLPVFQILTGQDLGGLILTPGVYFFASSAQLTGTLTLNGEGLADPVFVFQIGSTLTTASNSSVVMTNDGGSFTPGISVFWQVGSSATLGTGTAFEGNILALTSITANTGATILDGRVLARNGAVTLDGNNIMAPPAENVNVPDTGSTLLLLGAGLTALLGFMSAVHCLGLAARRTSSSRG
jgi:type VI secretion system secreted protein VgrG